MAARAGSGKLSIGWRLAERRRRSDPVFEPHDARPFRAVHAAEEGARLLHAMPDHLAAAVRALRGELVDGALEGVEGVGTARAGHCEGLVVIVAANIARRHGSSFSVMLRHAQSCSVMLSHGEALPFGLLAWRGHRPVSYTHLRA